VQQQNRDAAITGVLEKQADPAGRRASSSR
jgi:hypothetical protein